MSHERNEFEPASLDWQAWCYVAGEMPAAECDAFESRLEQDVAACEAVARAVELSDALAMTSMSVAQQDGLRPVSRPGHRMAQRPVAQRPVAPWRTRLAWMGVGAAASLAIVALGMWNRTEHRPLIVERGGVETERGNAVAAADDGSSMLALAWTELLGLDVAENDAGDSLGGTLAYAERSVVVAGEDDDSVAPDWLLAAVAEAGPVDPERGEAPSNQAKPN